MLAKKIPFKEINRLAVPAIIAGIVEPLISLTDTVVAGHIPSDTDEVLGAVGIVGSFISSMIWMFAQTSNAISSLVAQGVGQNRHQTQTHTHTHSTHPHTHTHTMCSINTHRQTHTHTGLI